MVINNPLGQLQLSNLESMSHAMWHNNSCEMGWLIAENSNVDVNEPTPLHILTKECIVEPSFCISLCEKGQQEQSKSLRGCSQSRVHKNVSVEETQSFRVSKMIANVLREAN